MIPRLQLLFPAQFSIEFVQKLYERCITELHEPATTTAMAVCRYKLDYLAREGREGDGRGQRQGCGSGWMDPTFEKKNRIPTSKKIASGSLI